MDGNPTELDPQIKAMLEEAIRPTNERSQSRREQDELYIKLFWMLAKGQHALEDRVEALEDKDEPWRASLRPDDEDGEDGE